MFAFITYAMCGLKVWRRSSLYLSRGEGSMYSLLQLFSHPNVNEYIGRQIDILYACTLPGDSGNVLRWCQGKVVEVNTGRQQPLVCVLCL